MFGSQGVTQGLVFKSVSAGEEKGIRDYESVITLMNGLINFSSSIVDGTVGRAGDRDLCFRHQAILSWIAWTRFANKTSSFKNYLVLWFHMSSKCKVLSIRNEFQFCKEINCDWLSWEMANFVPKRIALCALNDNACNGKNKFHQSWLKHLTAKMTNFILTKRLVQTCREYSCPQ